MAIYEDEGGARGEFGGNPVGFFGPSTAPPGTIAWQNEQSRRTWLGIGAAALALIVFGGQRSARRTASALPFEGIAVVGGLGLLGYATYNAAQRGQLGADAQQIVAQLQGGMTYR